MGLRPAREGISTSTEKLLEVSPQLIAWAIDLEMSEGIVVRGSVSDTPGLFLAGLCHASRLRTLLFRPLP